MIDAWLWTLDGDPFYDGFDEIPIDALIAKKDFVNANFHGVTFSPPRQHLDPPAEFIERMCAAFQTILPGCKNTNGLPISEFYTPKEWEDYGRIQGILQERLTRREFLIEQESAVMPFWSGNSEPDAQNISQAFEWVHKRHAVPYFWMPQVYPKSTGSLAESIAWVQSIFEAIPHAHFVPNYWGNGPVNPETEAIWLKHMASIVPSKQLHPLLWVYSTGWWEGEFPTYTPEAALQMLDSGAFDSFGRPFIYLSMKNISASLDMFQSILGENKKMTKPIHQVMIMPNPRYGAAYDPPIGPPFATVEQGVPPEYLPPNYATMPYQAYTRAMFGNKAAQKFKPAPGATSFGVLGQKLGQEYGDVVNAFIGWWPGFIYEGVTYHEPIAPLKPVFGVKTLGPLFGDSGQWFQNFAWKPYTQTRSTPPFQTYHSTLAYVKNAMMSTPTPMHAFILDNRESLANLAANLDQAMNAKPMADLGVPVWFWEPRVRPAPDTQKSIDLILKLKSIFTSGAKFMVDYNFDMMALMNAVCGVENVLPIYYVTTSGGLLELPNGDVKAAVDPGTFYSLVESSPHPEAVMICQGDSVLVSGMVS